MKGSLMTQQPTNVSIQGGSGSFHDIAARAFFKGDIEIVEHDNFTEVFAAVSDGASDYGVVAIENSVAGSILSNYHLLQESALRIIGEIYQRIALNLMALSGQTMADLQEVQSHYMAIAQCRAFFKDKPRITLVESADTAASAQDIAENKRTGVGAIASRSAARLFGLEILEEEIETNKINYTRFLILSRQGSWPPPHNVNKASLCFSVPDEIGSLSKVLSILTFYDINLTKIQSMPILGREWEYLMYVDVSFCDYARYRQALAAIGPLTETLDLLGEYTIGEKSFEKVHHPADVANVEG